MLKSTLKENRVLFDYIHKFEDYDLFGLFYWNDELWNIPLKIPDYFWMEATEFFLSKQTDMHSLFNEIVNKNKNQHDIDWIKETRNLCNEMETEWNGQYKMPIRLHREAVYNMLVDMNQNNTPRTRFEEDKQ